MTTEPSGSRVQARAVHALEVGLELLDAADA
jgi:hypothetical protein